MLFGTQPRLVTSSVPAWDSPARHSGGAAGPGTISGPITLTFNTLLGGLASSFPGQTTEENSGYFAFWATFDGSALPPIEYPYTSFTKVASESFITKTSNTPNTITLQFRSFPNIQFIVESSPDLVHWSEIKRVSTSALTNTESFSVEMTDNKSGFFRFRQEQP
jgi:hypothetical protein